MTLVSFFLVRKRNRNAKLSSYRDFASVPTFSVEHTL